MIALVVFQPAPTQAQARHEAPASSLNVLYMEVLGNGVNLSVNYERMIAPSPYRLRVGFAPPFYGSLRQGRLILTGGRSFDSKDRKDGLEAALGLVVSGDGDLLGSRVVATGAFGYRYEPQEGGLVFRIGATPFLGVDGSRLWWGFSMGYAFWHQ